MNPVVQEDRTGCALASVAALSHRSYANVKRAATALGIDVNNPTLWTGTAAVRRLLTHFQISGGEQADFLSWADLPDVALLAIKWHVEKSGPAWHWVVFVRETESPYVLDPKKALRTNRRQDFGRMKPKWFIPIQEAKSKRLV